MSDHNKPLLFFYDTEPDEVLPEYAKYKARISNDLRAAITASFLKEGRDTWLDSKVMSDVFTEDREDIVNSYNKVIEDVEARIEDVY
jgi:hypothetical protein